VSNGIPSVIGVNIKARVKNNNDCGALQWRKPNVNFDRIFVFTFCILLHLCGFYSFLSSVLSKAYFLFQFISFNGTPKKSR
jgi:hypothetical protein